MQKHTWQKLSFLMIRVAVVAHGIFLAFLNGYLLYFLADLRALPGFIFAIILIFPFNKLKRIAYLRIYFRLLLGSTTISLVLSYLQLLTPEQHSYLAYGYEAVILIVNVYIVSKYLQFKNSPLLGNPIYERKRFFIGGLTLLLLIAFSAGMMLQPFINIRRTPDGKQYFGLPSSPGSITSLFTPEALNSQYELASQTFFSNSNLACVIISRHSPGEGFLELSSQTKPMFRVEYDQTQPKQVTIFNPDGSTIQKPVDQDFKTAKQIFYKENGQFAQKDWKFDYSSMSDTAVTFLNLEPGTPISYSDNAQFVAGENGMIQVCEHFEYPVRDQDDRSRSKKFNLPWSVTVKDATGTIELIQENYTTI